MPHACGQDAVLLLAGDVASSLEVSSCGLIALGSSVPDDREFLAAAESQVRCRVLRARQPRARSQAPLYRCLRLWVTKKDGLSSVHKFLAILEASKGPRALDLRRSASSWVSTRGGPQVRLGLRPRPAYISKDCAVCPLFSWYKDT